MSLKAAYTLRLTCRRRRSNTSLQEKKRIPLSCPCMLQWTSPRNHMPTLTPSLLLQVAPSRKGLKPASSSDTTPQLDDMYDNVQETELSSPVAKMEFEGNNSNNVGKTTSGMFASKSCMLDFASCVCCSAGCFSVDLSHSLHHCSHLQFCSKV